VAAEPFCAEVLPRVDAWLARARSQHPAPADERYGGTVVVGSLGDLPGGMNALTSPDYAAVQHQQHVNLMTLLTYDEDLELRPWLARSWKVGDDGTTLTFRLRTDVFWHDGERTSARDVAFTYLRATDERTGFPNPALWDAYVPGPEGVEVVDDSTVVVRLQPHAGYLDVWQTLAILPEHLLGDVPPEELGAHPYGSVCPVGNGPFVFREHRPRDRWVFEAAPAFPAELGGRPFVDHYVYRVVPEQTTLLAELATGGVDVYIAPKPDQARHIADDPGLELRHYPFRNMVFVAWNARRPTLADARVRRAITMATNRREIVGALLHGYGTVANGRVPPYHWAFQETPAGTLPYDPTAAAALLDEAGWKDRDADGVREAADGTRLSITVKYNEGSSQRAQVAELMQAQLARVGVEIVPRMLEWSTLIGQITDPESRDFDGVVMAFVTDFRIDDTDLFHSSRRDEPYGWSGTQNAELDGLIERLRRTVDRADATALWHDYERVLNQEQPFTFFYFPDRLDGVSRGLENVRMDARGEWVNLKAWWIDPARRNLAS
jgi:peptide/nickel transport system substrate-binding protein